MLLDFNPRNSAFILQVPRSTGVNVSDLMQDFGLDFSEPESTADVAVLFTYEPYAATPFAVYATDAAYQQLQPILHAIDASWATDSDRHIDVPDGKELWPFQRASVAYALDRPHALIGDQPGLGKTEIAIAYANELAAERVLVICPANIRRQWCERIQEWSTFRPRGRARIIHPIFHARRGVNPNADWTVVSYELARHPKIGSTLAATSWDVVILDEAHYLKTADSLRTRAIFGGGRNRDFQPLKDRARRVLALSGTPLLNRPREAYTLARGLCFDSIDFMSEEKFKARFNPSRKIAGERPDGSSFIRIDERSGRHAELQARLRANFMVRHLKREVMPQLHLPVYDLVYLEETAAIRAALHAESMLQIDPDTLTGADVAILGDVATVRRQMGVAMAPQVADFIDMLVDGGEEKLVVFGWHHEVLDIWEKAWAHLNPRRIDGTMSSFQKEKSKHDFITDPSVKVIFGNMLAMGVGLDGLQHVASHGLIGEPDWTPANNLQAFDRLDRGGQRRQVQADIFVVAGSFAERVLASALRKLTVIDKALDRRVA